MPHIEKLYGYDLRDASAHERISKLQTSTTDAFNEVNETIYSAVEESKTDNTKAIEAIRKTTADAIEKNKTYVTPQEYGAVGDGVSDDTAAIQNALNNSDVHVTIPRGEYMISAPLYLYEDYGVTLELHDGAVIKATTAEPMIVIIKGSVNRPGMKCRVIGNGILDMNNVATHGVLLKASTRYAQIRNIDIANINTGIGIQVGEDGAQETASTLIDGVTVTGRGGTPVGSVGIKVYHYDCFIANVKVSRCFYGVHLIGGNNQLMNIHCWSDHPITSDNFANAIAINNESINQFTNVYCDSYATGIRTIYNLYVHNLYYYLGNAMGTPATNVHVSAIKTSVGPVVRVSGLEVQKKTGFIIDPVSVSGKGLYHNMNSWRRIKLSHGITYVDGFNPVSEAFNIRFDPFTTALNRTSMDNVSITSPVLVGYISKRDGHGELTIAYGGYWRGVLKIKSIHVNGLGNSTVDWSMYEGDASGVTVEIGEAVTINGFEYYPVYIKKTSAYNGFIDVDFKATGDLGFYLNAHNSIDDCVASETYTPIVTITN